MEVGDRVYLTYKGFIPNKSFPVKGSMYECIGTIKKEFVTRVNIKWDNGSQVRLLKKGFVELANDSAYDKAKTTLKT